MFILELNPLLMSNQGVGINFEYKLNSKFSLGADTEVFSQTLYEANGVTASREIYSFNPKLNYYLLSSEMVGPFVGFTFFFSESQARIYDDYLTANSNTFFIAPSAHLGYRFLFENGVTLSAYAGLGIKNVNNTFPVSSIPSSKQNDQNWLAAIEKLNHNVRPTQPDYGLTLGYIF